MELDLANIAINEKKRLKGFKVVRIFPYYLRYITTGTHIQLCAIKAEILLLTKGKEPSRDDFYNPELQASIMPLINKYIVVGLVNRRPCKWFFQFLLNKKIKRCGHNHILNLFLTLHKLNEPAFFLSYWNLITQVDNTLLKEQTPS